MSHDKPGSWPGAGEEPRHPIELRSGNDHRAPLRHEPGFDLLPVRVPVSEEPIQPAHGHLRVGLVDASHEDSVVVPSAVDDEPGPRGDLFPDPLLDAIEDAVQSASNTDVVDGCDNRSGAKRYQGAFSVVREGERYLDEAHLFGQPFLWSQEGDDSELDLHSFRQAASANLRDRELHNRPTSVVAVSGVASQSAQSIYLKGGRCKCPSGLSFLLDGIGLKVMKLILFGGAEIGSVERELKLIGKAMKKMRPKQVLHVPFARIKATETEWSGDWFHRHIHLKGAEYLNAKNKSDIAKADSPLVFISGGSEHVNLITKINSNSRLLKLIREASCIIGESAGSMVLGEYFRPGRKDAVKKMLRGLGILKDTIIEPHYTERGRESLLVEEVKKAKARYGIGIDSMTAMELELKDFPRKYKKIGKGKIVVRAGR